MALTKPSADLLSELEAIEAAVPGARAEYLEGEIAVNRPVNLHQYTIKLITRLLDDDYCGPDEEALPEVRVQTDDGWIIPDVVVVKRSLLESELPIPADQLFLAVEVLSPSTEVRDRGPKRKIFQAAQVDYWIAEPGQTVNIVEKYGYGGGRFSQ